jgi:flagellar biosynthesis protein FlhF
MNIKKFIGANSREALRKLKEGLGADAIILSNQTIGGQVEIMAMAANDMDKLAEKEAPKSAPIVRHQISAPVISSSLNMQPAKSNSVKFNPGADVSSDRDFMVPPSKSAMTLEPPFQMAQMMNEIRSMRGMLESKMAELSWSDAQKRAPHKLDIMREMLAAGFSVSLARHLIEKMPAQTNQATGMAWIKNILANNLNTIDNESEILEKGGVYALVGPTGVGKTTTTAKLAARCVMRHGPSKLALITTDGYRIGGYEQLRIYGKILGVMVHAVKDETDLKLALAELKNKHTVLIDTVGVGQRDKMVTEQVAMLAGAGSQVKRLLCLNATSTGETMSEVVRAYKGAGLAGCILTKIDEAATIGGALDIAIRKQLQVYYLASGQRVPEDLHVANKNYLIDRAFKLKRETEAFKYHDDELPMLISNLSQMDQFSTMGVTQGVHHG